MQSPRGKLVQLYYHKLLCSSSCWPSMHVFLSFEPCFAAPMNGSMHTFLSFEARLYLLHRMELHKEGFSWILQRSVLLGLESWRNCITYTLQPWTSHRTSEFNIECRGLGRRVPYPGIGCAEPIPVCNAGMVDYSGLFWIILECLILPLTSHTPGLV